MCRSGIERLARPIAAGLAALALGAMLGGCSEMYFDRRDTVALSGGDWLAANEAQEMIDPWPAPSANPNLAANGQRMQSAVEHYRTNTGVQPVDPLLIQNSNTSPPSAQNSSQTETSNLPAPPTIAPGTTTTTTTVVSTAPTPSQ
jgi:cell division septation protein DedD